MMQSNGQKTGQNTGLGFQIHDHDRCMRHSLAAAEAYCKQNKLQLTAGRKRVLEILVQEHKALGAYDILETLQREGTRAQPPVVYRALDFLMAHGLAHKIERLNAFVACCDPHHREPPSFLICSECKAINEVHVPLHRLRQLTQDAQSDFELTHVTVEAEGLCPACQN